jgi:tripartite-type tricarboxylate transporter receptor subunit TctC
MPGGLVLAKYTTKSVPFDIGEFAPIANLVFAPYVIIGAKGKGFNNLAEMFAFGRANPEKLAIGNSRSRRG